MVHFTDCHVSCFCFFSDVWVGGWVGWLVSGRVGGCVGRVGVCLCMYVFVCLCLCVFVCRLCVRVCVYVCGCVCLCVNMCVFVRERACRYIALAMQLDLVKTLGNLIS